MKISEKQRRIISALAKYLPALLFVLYPILLFFFFFAPVAVFEFIYAPASDVSFNVYQVLGEDVFGNLSGSMTALIVFTVITLIVSLVRLAFLENPFFGFTDAFPQKILEKLRLVFKFVPCLFYCLFFIITCVVFAKIGAVNEELGGLSALNGKNVIFAGACPVLLLVFTILFTLVHGAALVYEFFIDRNHVNPQEIS